MAKMKTRTITIKGKRTRISVAVYGSVQEALDELGSVQVLKDINHVVDLRAHGEK